MPFCIDTSTLCNIARQPGGVHLTIDERRACLNELALHERYAGEDRRGCDDPELARRILDAWKAYAKEQGVR